MAAKKIHPLPFHVYLLTVAAFAAVGLASAAYLAFSHYRVHTDVLYTSFCAISRAMNCDTVSASPYSLFLDVPVAVWGIFGYAFFLLLLLLAGSEDADKRRMWPLLMLTAAGFALLSLFLAHISRTYIRSYCLVCIGAWTVNFFLVYFTWITRRRFPGDGFLSGLKKDVLFLWRRKKKCGYLFTPLAAAVVLSLLFFPNYWRFELPPVSADTATGVTEEGHPWIGAEDPKLVITEYSDYRCFQCKKMHAYLRQIVSENPGTIRLVHKSFPMEHGFNPIIDAPFHQGSSKLAMAAAYAVHEGRFWEMNDHLYDIPRGIKSINVGELAEKTGVDWRRLAAAPDIKSLRYKVKRDIYDGIDLGITGTPAYVIDGEVYQGRIPVEMIRKAMK